MPTATAVALHEPEPPTMLRHRFTGLVALPPLLATAIAQVPIGGDLTTQMPATIRMRLLAFGIPIATSTAPTTLTGHIRTIGDLSQNPTLGNLPTLQIHALRIESFEATTLDTSLVLQGLNIALRNFRFVMNPCVGTLGTATVTPAGIARVLTDQNGIVAAAEGSVVLSGGTPPFAFNQTIDLASLGQPNLGMFGIYSLQPPPSGVQVEQHLELNSPPPIPFDFAGFTLDFQVQLNGGLNSVDLLLPRTGTDAVCCSSAVPRGTLFDRGTIADLPSAGDGVATGDFDVDGIHDLATGGNTTTFAGSVRVHRAIGGGRFATPVDVELPGTGAAPLDVLAGDLDGDGDLDLAALVEVPTPTFFVLTNDGLGTFAVAGSFAAGSAPRRLANGDVDGDGDLDLAVASSSFSAPGCNVLHNLGGAAFGAPVRIAFGSGLFDVELADIDGDGDLDVVAPLFGQDFFAFRRNNGNDGTFAAAVGFNTLTRGGDSPMDVALGDLDGDGDLDAAVVCSITNNLLLIRNTNGLLSSASFLTVPIQGADQARLVELGDLDLDGDLDLATADFSSTVPFRVTTFANDGTGVFGSARQHLVAGLGRGIGLADVDGDADLDLAAASTASFTKVLLNGCSGTRLPGALAATYGAGCAGSLGVPTLAPIGRPVLGSDFVARLANVPPGLASFLIGFSDQVVNGLPLPLPLQPFGLPAGCSALTSADVVVWVAHAGVADHVLTVPAAPALAGLPLFVQGGGFDATLPVAVPLVLSNGVRAVVGL